MKVCKSRAVAGNLLLPLPGVISYHQRAWSWGAGASDLIDNLLNDSKHRRCRAEQRLRKSVDRAQPQHRIR